MSSSKWIKKIMYNMNEHGFDMYEYVNEKNITIKVSHDKKQGLAGSNSVTVLGGDEYGGYLFGTPKSFKTKKQAERFVEYCKSQISNERYGHKVPFTI